MSYGRLFASQRELKSESKGCIGSSPSRKTRRLFPWAKRSRVGVVAVTAVGIAQPAGKGRLIRHTSAERSPPVAHSRLGSLCFMRRWRRTPLSMTVTTLAIASATLAGSLARAVDDGGRGRHLYRGGELWAAGGLGADGGMDRPAERSVCHHRELLSRMGHTMRWAAR